ncbi:hypothetical protein [Marinicellulosiphila megalodicopiae]|uniref:hypothetical protein n=1 Tax=Marinicellulosiphila megalodicopiae TaxID=2724896 RepID=UPI003BB1BFD8
MNISTTSFDHNYHNSKVVSSNFSSDYVLHQADIFCDIEIGDQTFCAMFQAGNGYLGNDYSRPDPKFTISVDGGADRVLELIDQICESDFDDSDLKDELEEINEYCEAIKTKNDLFEVWTVLRDLTIDANNITLASNDPEDWIQDECGDWSEK